MRGQMGSRCAVSEMAQKGRITAPSRPKPAESESHIQATHPRGAGRRCLCLRLRVCGCFGNGLIRARTKFGAVRGQVYANFRLC